MFQSARLKLTAWYLLLIMLISILFSVAFYNVSTREIQRIIRRIQFDQEQREHGLLFHLPPPNAPTVQTLEESQQHLQLVLVIINGIIFVLAGGAGYFLAGRTLKPIKVMVDEQNRFITDASHELRTPLTALKSEIEVYFRSKNHTLTEADTILASNLEEVNNLQILSDNLIQLAHYPKTNGTAVFTTVSLGEVMRATEKKLAKTAKQKSISFENIVHDYPLHGDKESLINLFGIFLDNAIKYSPEKSTITITAKKTDHTIGVAIADQGMGIEKKDIPHIFDRFYRADISRTKQTISGYGLGLSIAKKIIDIHHGSIQIKSELGKGTTFTIFIPAA